MLENYEDKYEVLSFLNLRNQQDTVIFNDTDTSMSSHNNLIDEQKKYVGKSAPPGCIEFMLSFHDFTKKQWATLGKHMSPRTGDLLVFPAKLQHTVPPFKSDVTRISVSGNLEIANRKNLGENYF